MASCQVRSKNSPIFVFYEMADRFPKYAARCLTDILNNLDSPGCNNAVHFLRCNLDNFSPAQRQEITLFIENLVKDRCVMLDLDHWMSNLRSVAHLAWLMFKDIEPGYFGKTSINVFEDIL